MGKAPLRTKSIGTKVSDEEYAQMEAQAAEGELTLSEWCREAMLASANGQPSAPPSDAVVLAEVKALRVIVLNLFYAVIRGDAITEERMEQIIHWADDRKLNGGTGEQEEAER